jgi:NADH-quinone oxidoreductase subunit F
MAKLAPPNARISIGMGTCGIGNGSDLVQAALRKSRSKDATARVESIPPLFLLAVLATAQPSPGRTGRTGQASTALHQGKPQRCHRTRGGSQGSKGPGEVVKEAEGKFESWDFRTSVLDFGEGFPQLRHWNEIPFFDGQEKIVLRDAGMINPDDIDEYIAVGGYGALVKAVSAMKPSDVIAEVEKSGLRGRGGAGFPTGVKWKLMRANAGETKYVICNADEGDPGAYMNRNEIESDPHMLVEGMTLGAYAMGASQGFVYVRAEYPLAVERLAKAMADAEAARLLGERILGSAFSFDLDIVKGAGAFVCGEETALIASAEGRSAGRAHAPPLPRPKRLSGPAHEYQQRGNLVQRTRYRSARRQVLCGLRHG